jgi:hypothetical protein
MNRSTFVDITLLLLLTLSLPVNGGDNLGKFFSISMFFLFLSFFLLASCCSPFPNQTNNNKKWKKENLKPN